MPCPAPKRDIRVDRKGTACRAPTERGCARYRGVRANHESDPLQLLDPQLPGGSSRRQVAVADPRIWPHPRSLRDRCRTQAAAGSGMAAVETAAVWRLRQRPFDAEEHE